LLDAERPSSPDLGGAGVELRAKLADVAWRTGRHGDALLALSEALQLADNRDLLRVARLEIRMGRVEMADHS
jgi:hypothetical protein